MALLLVLWPVVAKADGGVVRASERSGPFTITVFTAPSPSSEGPLDVSVMVQDAADGSAVVDARVSLLLTKEDGSAVAGEATREQAQNRLLYAALVEVPSPGRWEIRVSVARGPDSAAVSTIVPVDPPSPPILSYWPYLALPPVAVALFGLHQRSKRRR